MENQSFLLFMQRDVMKEDFLHFVWQFKRFNFLNLTTTDGETLELLDMGQINHTDGPDFLQAKIKIGTTIWVGNIEIHVRSSDWKRHGHSNNKNFDNIILHVVYEHDAQQQLFPFPTLELCSRIPGVIRQRFEALMQSGDTLPCAHAIQEINDITLFKWKERLLFERWESRLVKIEQLLQKYNGDLDRVAFIWLARYFGSGVNNDVFQEWAENIDPKWFLKLSDNPLSVEALILGQAGFLQKDSSDVYINSLKSEYQFLKHKWQLSPIPSYQWKWKRTRPASFPTVRLSLLSAFVLKQFPSFSMLIHLPNSINWLAGVTSHHYWHTHYRPEQETEFLEKHIGHSFAETITINVIVPLMILQYRITGSEIWLEKALNTLQQIPPEINSKVKAVAKGRFSLENAADSQAFLQMKEKYCDLKRCLHCDIGNKILRSNTYNQSQDDVNLSVHEACA